MAHDVFISHSAKDKATADAVCATLESNGIRCWIAPRDVLPSMEWSEAIIDAIEQCRIMVLVFTAHANDSPQIRREVERAVNRGLAILPLRVEDVVPGKSLEYFIGNVHWLDALTPPFEAHLENLAGTIKIVLARTEPGASPAPAHREKPPASSGRGAETETPENAGAREKTPAPRRFWSASAWTWAAGTVSALLLVSIFVDLNFTSRPAPAASSQPGPPPAQSNPGAGGPGGAAPGAVVDSAASLRDAMSTLQNELSSIATVSFTSFWNGTGGSHGQTKVVEQVGNVVADPAQCRVSYHWRTMLDGKPYVDMDAWIPLSAVTSVDVEPMSREITEFTAQTGHPQNVTSTAPPVLALRVFHASTRNMLPFTDAALANRTAETVKQAVRLCGGTLAN